MCENTCDNSEGCWDTAYPLLLLRLLPSGLRGVLMAAALSSLVASLASIFNSASTIFTLDVWVFFRGAHVSQLELLLVGR